MAEMVYVVPAAGGRVRQPERNYRVMPEVGDFVPLDAHYERLLIAGDICRADPPTKKSSTPAEEAAAQQGKGRRPASAVSEG